MFYGIGLNTASSVQTSFLKLTVMKNLLIVLIAFVALAEPVYSNADRTISGKVTDTRGDAIPGVFVQVDKSGRNTISNQNGNYRIVVYPSDKLLVFSFVGMETQKIKIGSDSIIHICMKESTIELEETVVVGYGVQKKESVFAASSHVTGSAKGIMIRGVSAPMPYSDMNTENYATIRENGFRNVVSSPLSTFSIDVDKASYSNVRRYINQGMLPPADAVRVEEMVNYFRYDYPEPSGKYPFNVSAELSDCPWKKDHYLLHIGLKAKSIDKSKLPPSNLVFLIDVSGSMNTPNKLPLLKQAFSMLTGELRHQDQVAVVVYAGAAGKVLDSTTGDEKRTILDALEKLQAGGSTAGGEGLKLAYKTARENFIEGGNNRIILATDGDFNVGVSSTSEMERLVEKERESGIFMTVLGFGMGNIKDDKMETIADKGNGNYGYIDNIQEARKMFITEFGGTLFTVAKDVKFQLEFNPLKVKAYRLVGYENRLLNAEDFSDDKKDAGEMGSGHTVTALYEIIPSGAEEEIPAVDPLKYQNQGKGSGKGADEILTIKLRYKEPDGNTSRLFELPLKEQKVAETSDNFRFSAAVASFGMLLRNSEFKGDMSLEKVVQLAKGAKGDDEEGDRAEFIRLARTVSDLKLLVSE